MNSRILASMILCAFVALTTPVHADAVTYWNEVAVGAANTGRPGPQSLLDLALVHAAVHDAVQCIEGRYQPYHYSDPATRGIGSTSAAAAAAAHRALVLIYPDQKTSLDTIYASYIEAANLGGDAGLAVGEFAADALYRAHYRPVVPMEPFRGRNEIGQWRSTAPMATLYLAFTEPFTLKRASQFRPAPPPHLKSAVYTRDFAEVKSHGSSTSHPSSKTEMAQFWTVNPAPQWNEALREIADARITDLGDRARLFALANLAAADALIAVWDCKVHYNSWRPSTAIHEADADHNPRTGGDLGWTSLIPDPPYPDYVSGLNGVTGAFTGALQHFFETDELSFTVRTTNPVVVNKARQYSLISDAAQEAVDARILLGIHFRFADEEGRRLGSRVAHWAFMKFLRPVPQE